MLLYKLRNGIWIISKKCNGGKFCQVKFFGEILFRETFFGIQISDGHQMA